MEIQPHPNLALLLANKKKSSPILPALIDIIRRKVEERVEIEILSPIRHVVVHFEGCGCHDWSAKRATWRRWCAGKNLACVEAGKLIGCEMIWWVLAREKSMRKGEK